MIIDLHTHSNFSDGTQSPAELMAQAKKEGLDVVALTDHDSVAGWESAADAAEQLEVTLIRGSEFTARMGDITVHLLSYLHDPLHPAIVAHNEFMVHNRLERMKRITGLISRDYPVKWDDVLEVVGDEQTVIGRPHLADALVRKGILSSREEAFAGLLKNGSPYLVHQTSTDAITMIETIRTAGGVAVFAHPGAIYRGRVVDDVALTEMVAAGLQGLEVFHRDNPPEQRQWLAQVAHANNLLVTGSSDYHGQGKLNRLAENTTTPEVYEQIVALGRIGVVGPGAS